MSGECDLCRPEASRIVYAGHHVLGLWSGEEGAQRHILLAPKRHVASWVEASEEEQGELFSAITAARDAIEHDRQPTGYRLAADLDAEEGARSHFCLQVWPRFGGAAGGDWPSGAASSSAGDIARDREDDGAAAFPALVTGGDDPLLPHLTSHIANASRVRIAVAFVLPSGVGLLYEHLRDLCERRGRLQLLTGDYQDVTDPDALARLLDLREEYAGQVDLRVFECRSTSFHPKAYLFEGAPEGSVAFVGSSNLTRTALRIGVEWNYGVVPSRDAAGYREVTQRFDELFQGPHTRELTREWLEEYRGRRREADPSRPEPAVADPEEIEQPPEPHEIQKEALAALEGTRAAGAQSGLVVLATGLGKTWLSAFDSQRPAFRRVLFVAHRDEILGQALKTFRRIRPRARLGLYTGAEKDGDADVVFASVQTLSREAHLKRFDRREFDYVIVDEFHHAAAATYRRVIDYFEPKFLLGLTATPERTDGGDLLSLCGENLVYRCDVREAITRGFLVPFRYFGVPDNVNYENIPWRSSRFDEEKLTEAVSTRERAQNALEQLEQHGGRRVLAFCCSKRHANFMRDFFLAAGIPAAAVHSGEGSNSRAGSLEKLEQGDLRVVFAVDMFNEGVDIPSVDTVLMLRPTESRLLWMQQFGRGLRESDEKEDLAVIDYIGNHRSFLLKAQALFDLLPGDQHIRAQIERLQAGEPDLPPGCEVTYDLEALDILSSLLREPKGLEVVQSYYETFRELNGRRPTASEALHDGYSPRAVGREYGSWLRFVEAMGDLGLDASLLDTSSAAGRFLEQLESTPMTKSYKMLVLLGMIHEGQFPGEIEFGRLTHAVERLARRSPALIADVGTPIDSEVTLRSHLEKNPIAAWTAGRGTAKEPFFHYEQGVFRSALGESAADRDSVSELAQEIAEYRLAEYLRRPGAPGAEQSFRCRVSHADGRPILFLPDRAKNPEIPEGWAPVIADGQVYEANFVKVAVNVMRRLGSEENALSRILRHWFGDDAGAPGTRAEVVFSRESGEWHLEPVHGSEPGLELWRSYSRKEVAERFGEPYSRFWEQGFVPRDGKLFLFVTLDKSGIQEEYRYGDHFLDRQLFEWQSQNRTRRDTPTGEKLRRHAEMGIDVHLLVRKQAKLEGRGAPFFYCGSVEFVDWEGDKPITIRWRLAEPVPDSLWASFGP